jgi:hypothetical protein
MTTAKIASSVNKNVQIKNEFEISIKAAKE